MAVAIRAIGASTGTTTAVTGTGLTFATPAGTATGDLLLAVCGAKPGSAGSFSAPDVSWTQIGTWAFTTNTGISAFWKIATSTDASNANTGTFSLGSPTNGTATGLGGYLYAITGHDPTTPINAQAQGTANGATATVTGGVTPSVTNCLLFMCADTGSAAGTFTQATVAVVNNNPTWTRQSFGAFSTITVAVATGTYAASTSTGNATWTVGATNNYGAKLIAVAPDPGGGGSPTVKAYMMLGMG